MSHGQSFLDAASNVNLTQAAVAGLAGAVGAGAVNVAVDFYKSGRLFSTEFDLLSNAEREQIGDLFMRAQAAAALILAKKEIGNEYPFRPFSNDYSGQTCTSNHQ